MANRINDGKDQPTPHPSRLLDIIIPTYKRPQGTVVAAMSVLSQLNKFKLEDSVNLTIWDDCTPGLAIEQISSALFEYVGLFSIGQNKVNKGMSRNIYDLVKVAKSSFCTVLTDDDWFEPDTLLEILDVIRSMEGLSSSRYKNSVGAFFVPRYSYLDDESLHCIECTPFSLDTIVVHSPLNTIRYCRNAFILTGLFFKHSLVDFSFWRENQENAFVPLLYYSSVSILSDVKYLNRKWFHHTCLNLCHWDAWGRSDLQRNTRLHRDYIRVLTLVAQKYPADSVIDRLQHAKSLSQAFDQQLLSYKGPVLNQFLVVFSLSRHSPILAISYAKFLLRRLFFVLIFILNFPVRRFRS